MDKELFDFLRLQGCVTPERNPFADEIEYYEYANGKCYECVFWGPDAIEHMRDYGCRIWDFVKDERETPSGMDIPYHDHYVCKHYRKYTAELVDGRKAMCGRCEHFDISCGFENLVDYSCTKREKVERMLERAPESHLNGVAFGNEVDSICPLFKWR